MNHANVTPIKVWFERAVPSPTDKNRSVQLGVHLEEVAEMFAAFGDDKVASQLDLAAHQMKTGDKGIPANAEHIDRKELLDSLCDQIVTAVGVAHMFGLDIVKALNEVNRSNWSKFDENGQPIFNEHGKIAKGQNYTPPYLDGLF